MARSPRLLAAVVLSLALSTVPTAVVAQPFEVGGVTYALSKTMGTVGTAGQGVITIKSAVSPMQILVSDAKLAELKKSTVKAGDPPITTAIEITGTADPSFLVKDHCVSFSAELKNGKGVSPVKDLRLFTPKSSQELSIASDTGEAPGTGGGTGMFLISGQIISFGKGQMKVTVPTEKGRKTTVTVSVASDAKIDVNISDLSVVQPGDTVAADGYVGTPKGGKPLPSMLAESLKITLAKPLMSKLKRRELASAAGAPRRDNSPAKAKPQAATERKAPADEPPAGLRDPSMPDKPEPAADKPSLAEELAAAEKQETESKDPTPRVEPAEDEKVDEEQVEEELIVVDTFVVDGNHSAKTKK